jgi:thymidylate synthase (FAD)
MAYIARVSSPKDVLEKYKEPERLLGYCMRNGHWSVFEHAHLTIEVEAPIFVTRQILRHRSFTFSEFSQRYAEVPEKFLILECRMQDHKNRQSSLPCTDPNYDLWWDNSQEDVYDILTRLYQEALSKGIAKEVARAILPMSTMSTIFITGSVRSWVHYLQTRLDVATQKEHQEVAILCATILAEHFPIVYEAMNLKEES